MCFMRISCASSFRANASAGRVVAICSLLNLKAHQIGHKAKLVENLLWTLHSSSFLSSFCVKLLMSEMLTTCTIDLS